MTVIDVTAMKWRAPLSFRFNTGEERSSPCLTPGPMAGMDRTSDVGRRACSQSVFREIYILA
jgi:hypothetical protein